MSTKEKGERITQVKLTKPCSHTWTGFVCVTYVPDLDGHFTDVPCKGELYDICWIRSDLAKIGKTLKVDGEVGHWTVAEVYGSKFVHDLDGQHHAWREFGKKLGY